MVSDLARRMPLNALVPASIWAIVDDLVINQTKPPPVWLTAQLALNYLQFSFTSSLLFLQAEELRDRNE